VMKVRQSAKNNESNGSTEYDFKKAEERWSKYWQERGLLKLMGLLVRSPNSTCWKCSRTPQASFTWDMSGTTPWGCGSTLQQNERF